MLLLAQGLAGINGIHLDPATVETNIVIFEVDHPRLTAPALAASVGEKGIRVLAIGPRNIRAVTHLDVNRDDILTALEVFGAVLA